MKQSVLIVVPRYVNRSGEFYEFPLGLALIAAALRKTGRDVACLNLNHHDTPQEQLISEAIHRTDAGVICTGGFSTHFRSVKRALDAASAARPNIMKIAGGSLVTSEPMRMTQALGLHIGVVGEGEFTLVEALDACEQDRGLADVPGIIYRDANGILSSTEPRPYIDNLDSVPLPDYTGFDIETYLDIQRPDDRQYLYVRDNPRFLYTVASRACPFHCTFCFPMFGSKVRKRSLDNFFSEVDHLVDAYGINILGVFDALFDTSTDYLEDFCRRIREYDLHWFMQVRVDSLDEERLALLKESGVFAVLYGLESASDTMLKKMKKASTASQIENALALSRRLGVRIMGEFIFGHPDETWDTAMETLGWWKRHSRYQIDMGHVYPFPGCGDYRHCMESGIIPDPVAYIEGGCRIVNMTKMDNTTYERLFREIADTGRNQALFGVLEAIEREGPDEQKNSMAFTFTCTCPLCGTSCRYPHYHVATLARTLKYPFSCVTFTCRACNQAYSLKADDIFLKCPDRHARRQFIDDVRTADTNFRLPADSDTEKT